MATRANDGNFFIEKPIAFHHRRLPRIPRDPRQKLPLPFRFERSEKRSCKTGVKEKAHFWEQETSGRTKSKREGRAKSSFFS